MGRWMLVVFLPFDSACVGLVPHTSSRLWIGALGTSAKTTGNLGKTYPHPGPLPSDGRGRMVHCRQACPTAFDAPRDSSGCSLSRRTGEGRFVATHASCPALIFLQTLRSPLKNVPFAA